MTINWFGVIIAIAYIGAAVYETVRRNYIMSAVYVSYAFASFCLAFIKSP